jgi:DNA (cytosine-5)-methyltransferase 1
MLKTNWQRMKVLSLFSGVGGFDMGLERAGMQTVFQCEWDKHANTILNRHWPHVSKWEDVSTLTGKHILAHAPVIDVVAWGSPCQDLSVAGKRSGLEGERSGLFHEGIRIIKELRKETNGQYPRISIWENVVGALNSNRGADFGIIINEMAQAGAMVIEWAVLDAQYFGVPQRRRRVFVIAIFDPVLAERCPSPLLPVAESLPRHLAKSKPKRQSATSKTAESVGTDDTIVGDNAPILIDRSAFNQGKNALYQPHISDDPISPSLVAQGPHAVFTKSSRAQTADDSETWVEGAVNPTLNSFDQGDVRATTAIVFENSYRDGARIANDGVTQTLSAKMGTGGGNTPMLAVAYSIREDAKAGNFSATELDHANSLSALRPSPQSHHAQMFIAEPTMAVRRLTPLECERLMGWPDDHTRYKADGTEQADTHRYKQCGNGVASPVAQWIAKHLLKLEEQQ